MDIPSVASPRISSDQLKLEGSEDTRLHNLELELSDSGNEYNAYQFHFTSALEILRESVRVLRFNSSAFMITAAVLICPLSAVHLSNLLVNQHVVKKLTYRLLLVAEVSGISLNPFVKQLCHKLSEMTLSLTMCFPLFVTLFLLSKAAVAYSVDCTYLRKPANISKFFVIVGKIWRRLLLTYLWVCMVIVGCLTLFFCFCFFYLYCTFCNCITPDLVLYVAIIVGLVFSVVYANVVVICNIGIVISVLEDVSGSQALLRSGALIKGQTQVGLLLFLISTIGMAFIEGLFDHRVKMLSYGDGSSRIWEGRLLVLMYSFVVLIDSVVNAVFYFSCKCYSMGAGDGESEPILETVSVSSESPGK